MKVAIVSDSHGSKDRLIEVCKNLQESGIKHVIHCGDFLCYEVDKIFEEFSDINFYIAIGNCDVNTDDLVHINSLKNCVAKDVVSCEIGGKKFASSHIEGIAENIIKDADVFCHGHTHRQKIEHRNGFLVINPGALCEDGSYFIVETENLKSIKKEERRINL